MWNRHKSGAIKPAICQWLESVLDRAHSWQKSLLVFIVGGIIALGLPPLNIILAPFIGFSLFILILEHAQPKKLGARQRFWQNFMLGWWFGFGYFTAGLWWLGHAMLIEPNAFAWAIPFAVLGLPAFLAIYWGLASAFSQIYWTNALARLLSFVLFLAIFEWLRAIAFSGFPWNSVGYLIMVHPLWMQSAFYIGLYGVNILALLLFCLPSMWLRGEKSPISIVLFGTVLLGQLALAFIHMWPTAPSAAARTITIRLIQPAISQSEKSNSQQRFAQFEKLLELTSAPADGHKPDVIVWPETSLPYIIKYNPQVLQRISYALSPGQIAIIGSVTVQAQDQSSEPLFFNSIEAIDQKGQVLSTYNKNHLVPFGEYLPLASWLAPLDLEAISTLAGNFSPGRSRKSVSLTNGLVYLPYICYEVIFPEKDQHKASFANVIINVTNDAWFGSTPGPYQHLQQARLKAVEMHLPLLRAANNGISAVIDPHGRIIAQLGLNDVGYLDSKVVLNSVPVWDNNSKGLIFWTMILILFLISVLSNLPKSRH